jgi:hypothetical protein
MPNAIEVGELAHEVAMETQCRLLVDKSVRERSVEVTEDNRW